MRPDDIRAPTIASSSSPTVARAARPAQVPNNEAPKSRVVAVPSRCLPLWSSSRRCPPPARAMPLYMYDRRLGRRSAPAIPRTQESVERARYTMVRRTRTGGSDGSGLDEARKSEHGSHITRVNWYACQSMASSTCERHSLLHQPHHQRDLGRLQLTSQTSYHDQHRARASHLESRDLSPDGRARSDHWSIYTHTW